MDEIVSIDTNVLVRFLVNEDVRQCAEAKELFKRSPCFIPESVLLEAEWVMRAVYGVERVMIARAYRALLRMETVIFADASVVRQVLDWFEADFDFADALHLARSEGHSLKTFDRAFVKKARKHGYHASLPAG